MNTKSDKSEKNRINQLQTTLTTIQIRSFLVLILKSLNFTIVLQPSRKKCKQLPDITNFIINGFFQGNQIEYQNYFQTISQSIQFHLQRNEKDYMVKRYSDFKMIEIIVQFLQMYSIPIKESYKKHEIKLGSIVRIAEIQIYPTMSYFILMKMMNLFTDEYQSLKDELMNCKLTEKNIELLGDLFYKNELKFYLETQKKQNGRNSFLF